MSRPTRDDAIAKHHADREQEYHAIMVRNGLRPEGSKVEDYRPKPAHVEPAPVVDIAAILRRKSEAAEQ